MPEEFFETVAHHLPPERPVGSRGGRPRIGHRVVIRVIWSVVTTGARWEDVPPELGCSGRTAHRRLRAWEEAGIWDRLHADLLAALNRAGKLDADTVAVDGVTVRAFGGGEATRALLRWLGIESHIAKRKTPHGSGLGKVRWVVERTISWLKGLRRLRVRYDRLGVIIDARTTLAASVVCFRMLYHDVI